MTMAQNSGKIVGELARDNANGGATKRSAAKWSAKR
jgi:hypothetical protein